jgi:hypothetical protein
VCGLVRGRLEVQRLPIKGLGLRRGDVAPQFQGDRLPEGVARLGVERFDERGLRVHVREIFLPLCVVYRRGVHMLERIHRLE